MLTCLMALVGCGESLPPDIVGYETNTSCVRLNQAPIEPYEGDPHKGFKNVFACNVDPVLVAANKRPFPDGTLIVKESRRSGENFIWLVATARKSNGRWRWDEYTRNFDNEDHQRLLLKQSKCTDCHKQAAAQDFIYTRFASR